MQSHLARWHRPCATQPTQRSSKGSSLSSWTLGCVMLRQEGQTALVRSNLQLVRICCSCSCLFFWHPLKCCSCLPSSHLSCLSTRTRTHVGLASCAARRSPPTTRQLPAPPAPNQLLLATMTMRTRAPLLTALPALCLRLARARQTSSSLMCQGPWTLATRGHWRLEH